MTVAPDGSPAATARPAATRRRPLFTYVRQVCTVVPCLDLVLRDMVEHLGIGPFRCWSFGPPDVFETTWQGSARTPPRDCCSARCRPIGSSKDEGRR